MVTKLNFYSRMIYCTHHLTRSYHVIRCGLSVDCNEVNELFCAYTSSCKGGGGGGGGGGVCV